MKTYQGKRTVAHGCQVIVVDETVDEATGSKLIDRRRLDFRLDLRNHSPTGFEWGYLGSGPAQLAIAILADSLGAALAEEHYQHFKESVIAKLPAQGWEFDELFIRRWLARQKEVA